MKILKPLAALALIAPLAACGDTDIERGLTGAAGGVVAAELLDESLVTGAVLGGAAGVLCDDVNLCP
jgi:hypothetical protein